MSNTKTGYLFPIFALFVFFNDELFFSFISFSGIELESGLKSREAIVIAVTAYMMIFSDMVRGRLTMRNYLQFAAMVVILILYYITGLKYPHSLMYGNYVSSLLSFGALCVPSCYVGIRLSHRNYDEQVIKLLPVFILVVSAVVGSAIWIKSMTGAILRQEEDGLSYQTSSYYMAYCFSYCVFYVFYKRKERGSYYNIINYILYAIMFFCAISTVYGGGRGAFVYLVAITAFLVYRFIIKKRGVSKGGYVFLLAGAIIIMFIIVNYLKVFDSVGANRIMERLTVDDTREFLWDKAMDSFNESPLYGHGLGSIWWTIGYYSHNMLADLLAETGLIGTAIILFFLIKMLLSLRQRSFYSDFNMLMYVFFIGTLVHDSFSGYWISSPKLFLIFGYVFGAKMSLKSIKCSTKAISNTKEQRVCRYLLTE